MRLFAPADNLKTKSSGGGLVSVGSKKIFWQIFSYGNWSLFVTWICCANSYNASISWKRHMCNLGW